MNAKQEAYAEKIAKLLRHAEKAGTQEEAETFLTKAQELMVTWAIDEEMLAKAQGKQVQEQIVEKHIAYTGIFQAALYDIGAAVAKANNCRVMISTRDYVRDADGKMTKKKNTVLYVIGFESDVARVRMLDASVQIQATSAMTRWWKEQDSSWMSSMEKFKARREFLFGFARGLSSKLREAAKAGQAQAVANEAARHGDTEEAKAEATTGVELVLRSRADQVKDWQDEKYGGSLRRVSRNYSSGGYGASQAGHAAGRSADVGGSRIAGRRGELGS